MAEVQEKYRPVIVVGGVCKVPEKDGRLIIKINEFMRQQLEKAINERLWG